MIPLHISGAARLASRRSRYAADAARLAALASAWMRGLPTPLPRFVSIASILLPYDALNIYDGDINSK